MLTRRVVEGIQLAGGTILVSASSLLCTDLSTLLSWEPCNSYLLWHVFEISDLDRVHSGVRRHDGNCEAH